jgi:hypothetical protein
LEFWWQIVRSSLRDILGVQRGSFLRQGD